VIVVSDTSPITNLIDIGRLELLRAETLRLARESET
jgi:predicted nucleic acid-binding protein